MPAQVQNAYQIERTPKPVRIPQSMVPLWYALMVTTTFFYGMLVGFVCAKAYSINIRVISPKNLFKPLYV